MSEDPSPPKEAPVEAAEAAPRVRRISNPRPKKTAAKEAAGGGSAAEPSSARAAAADAPGAADAPTAATVTEAQASQDWPEAETVSDASRQTANDKRKRRRRKGKGGGPNSPNAQGQSSVNEEVLPMGDAPASKESGAAAQISPPPRPVQAPVSPPQQPQQARSSASPELVAKRAWKIFLAEVSEEGVALISDHEARELSKRCFRLAEIFLDEQGRKQR